MNVRRRWLVAGACLAVAAVLVLFAAVDDATSTSAARDARVVPARPRPLAPAAVAQEVALRPPAAPDLVTMPPLSEESEEPEPASMLIRGTVRDGRGRPIEPFDVTLSIAGATTAPATSDGQGRFALSLDRLPPGSTASAVLEFRACGFARLTQPVQLRGGEDCVLEAVLEPATDAPAGRVLDERGQPVAGAEVRVRMSGRAVGMETVRSDAEGRFTFRCAHGPDVESMEFVHPECLDHRLERADVGADWHALEVVLRKGCVLTGTVLDAWGRPAAAVQVRAAVTRPDAPQTARGERSAVSDASGTFAITGMAPGQVALEFRRPGARPGTRACLTDWVVAAEDHPDCGTFTLPAGTD